MTEGHYALYLSGGVGDLMMQMYCHRIAVGAVPIAALCPEAQLKTAKTIDALVRRIYFPDQSPMDISSIPDKEARELFANLSDARRLEPLVGPRVFLVRDHLCLSRWVYFSGNYDLLRTNAQAWLELYARYNGIGETVARNQFFKNKAPLQARTALEHALADRRSIQVNVAVQSNSVWGDVNFFVDLVKRILSRLSRQSPVTLAIHQMKQGLRPDAFERKIENFQASFDSLVSLTGVQEVQIVDGEFADVVSSLEQSNLLIAVRSGICDIATVLGIPQVNLYDNLASYKTYRHSVSDPAFGVRDQPYCAIGLHNVPSDLAGVIKKDII